MLKQVIEIVELLDDARINGDKVRKCLEKRGLSNVTVTEVKGKEGKTDFIKVIVEGKKGKLAGGNAPTLGIIGRLGGIGARPEMIGKVLIEDER